MTRRWGLVLLPLLAQSSACSSSTDDSPILCEQYAFGACEVTEAGCQRSTMELLRCLRETDPASDQMPEVRQVTGSELTEELLLADSESDPEIDELLDRVLWSLRLLEPQTSLAQAESDHLSEFVGAFYLAESETVFLGAPGVDSYEGVWQTILLGHEFVHHEQNRELGLDAWRQQFETTEGALAARSLVEGEAQLYEMLLADTLLRLRADETEFSAHITTSVGSTDDAFGSPNPIVLGLGWFPYGYGFSYVYGAYSQGGPDGVRDLFVDLPTTLEIIQGVPAGTIEQQSPAPRELPDGPWEEAATDTLGSWVTRLIAAQFVSEQRAVPIGDSWQGDLLQVFRNTDVATESFALWQLQLDAPDQASALADALVSEPGVVAEADGGLAVVLIPGEGSFPPDYP